MEANKKSGTVTKIDVQQQVRSLLKITLGNAVMGFAYAKWMVPHQIINGGITSVSMLLDRLLGGGVATWTNGLTLVLLLCCAIFLGKENFFKSLFSSVTYLLSFNLFYDLAFQVTLSIWFDVPLACVAVAFGYYCCISENASTVGVDVIALILHRRNEQIRIAPTIRNINFVILGVGLFVFGWKSVAFGIGFSILYAWILRHMLRE